MQVVHFAEPERDGPRLRAQVVQGQGVHNGGGKRGDTGSVFRVRSFAVFFFQRDLTRDGERYQCVGVRVLRRHNNEAEMGTVSGMEQITVCG